MLDQVDKGFHEMGGASDKKSLRGSTMWYVLPC